MENLSLFTDLQLLLQTAHAATEHDQKTGLQITGNDMQGTVQKVRLETGLHLYCWKLNVLRPHHFVVQLKNKDQEKTYMLVYFFQPLADRLRFIVADQPPIVTKETPFLLLHSNETPVTAYFNKPVSYDCLAVSFTHDWLFQQLSSLKHDQAASDYVFEIVNTLHYRALSKGELILSKALFGELQASAFMVEVKAHLYNLVTFLYRQVRISAYKDGKNHYRPILTKLEKKIMASLYTSLPPLHDLAKEFYMSFSSLNRHFKDHYGATIYDYYLEQKMLLAQQLLREGHQSVNAVAFQLGYESVTHFIAIFKKIHGHSPGQVKKELD